MPEDQIAALPPEVRAMVMTGATSLMSGGALPHGPPQLMGVGVGGPGPMMHPHPHEMGMMGVMNAGEMQQGPGMMQGPGQEGDGMGLQGMQQEGFQQNGPGPGQMMGMSQEFGMQVRSLSPSSKLTSMVV